MADVPILSRRWSDDSCAADKHCASKIGANKRDQEDWAIGESDIEQNELSINLQEKSSTFLRSKIFGRMSQMQKNERTWCILL